MKKYIRAFLHNLGWEVKRLPPTLQDFKQAYQQWQGTPWSQGYTEAKNGLICKVIENQDLLELFSNQKELPQNYGIGFDERCVEYPWLLSQLTQESTTILDAGSVLNFQFLLEQPIFANKKLHILTLAPENNCFWNQTISYLYDDLRSIPIRDDYYDVVVCLSTLEHIGCNNTLYTKDMSYQESCPDDFIVAIQELRRVIKPGGSLFLSVPFGTYRYFGAFQQFDYSLLQSAIEAFQPAKEVTETFYRYTPQGWQIANAKDCENCEYVEWLTKPFVQHQIPNPTPVESDLAAAARAVACVHLVKPNIL